MKESVIYQDILQKGEQKEALRFCLSLIDECFGELDSSIIDKIKILNIEQLEALGRMLFRMSSVDDLVTWLSEQ